MNDRQARTRSSILWAAWADALGFISELTSAENLRRRTHGRALTQPMAWSRVVGGRAGVRAELPEGCYSDDTQLRLATSRAISSYGFDVEAFARVELPVWPSYALGGGRASRAAAAAMSKQQANWANNFFDGWENSGGNGAAMRIQPHVYAARNLGSLDHIDDVIRNSIVTHGHPRGIVGAVFHAISLTFTLDTGRLPGPKDFGVLLGGTHSAFSAFSRQPELSAYWLPQWERKAETSFEVAWHHTVDEVEELLRSALGEWERLRSRGHDRKLAAESYEGLVGALRLDDEKVRGSATNTTVAALLLAAAFPDHPAQAAQVAASRLHTDTDTIGTMAAALVGAASPRSLISPVSDATYLAAEAERLWAVASGRKVPSTRYPDLLQWQPPRSALDATGLANGQFALAGIGYLTITGRPMTNKDGVWEWAETDFGQSMLVKHRRDLRELSPGNHPASSPPVRRETPGYQVDEPTATGAAPRSPTHVGEMSAGSAQSTLFDQAVIDDPGTSIEALLAWLDRNAYQDADIGRAIRIIVASGSSSDVWLLIDAIAQGLRRQAER